MTMHVPPGHPQMPELEQAARNADKVARSLENKVC